MDNEGLTPIWKEENWSKVYVNGYLAVRNYGGPEEGGWWYNSYEPVFSYLIPDPNIQDPQKMQNRFYRVYNYLSEGDIYSMRGGQLLCIYVEDHFAQFWSESSHYE